MKKNEVKFKFCKGDIFAIGLVAASAVFVGILFWKGTGQQSGKTAAVYLNGKLIRELPLDRDNEFIVEDVYTNHIVVKDGEAFIEDSDCPGNDCVHSGAIHEAGRSIVCLPNRVEIRIEGTSEVDFVVR